MSIVIKEEDLHLNSFKIGAELSVIKATGEKLEYTGKRVISSWDNRFDLWRSNKGEPIPPNGKGYYSMCSKEGDPHFYYSANPKHLRELEVAIISRKKANEEHQKAQAALSEEFHEKLNSLLKEYNAEIIPIQLSGDDQGVKLGIEIAIYP